GLGVEPAHVAGVVLHHGAVAVGQDRVEVGGAAEERRQVTQHTPEVERVALDTLQLGMHRIGDRDAALLQVLARTATEGGQVGELLGVYRPPVQEGVAVDVDHGELCQIQHVYTTSR